MIGRVLPRRATALAYHGVGDVTETEDPQRLVVSPAHLEEHVRLLQRRGYEFLTAEELLARHGGAKPPPGTAVLTFDDGWADALTTAAPLLQRLGVRATFYVCPGRWGEVHPLVAAPAGRLLDAAGTRALQDDAGMELGAHSMTHPDLRALDDTALEYELAGSKAAVEEVTGRTCRTFAYPFGLMDDRVERAVAAAGYELAWGWLPGPWRPLAAPRLPAPPRNGARRLALKMLGLRRPGR